MRWVTESKWIETQVGKVLSFKPQVSKVKMGLITGEFSVISLIFYHIKNLVSKH